jgi:hypothetical protein
MAPRNSQSHSSEMRGAHHSDAIAARRHGEAIHNPLDPPTQASRALNLTEYKKVSDFILV